MALMQVHLVCPRCSYGFTADESDEYACPGPDCGHRWQSLTTTIATAFTTEGRQARPELAVRSGERTGLVFAVDQPRVVLGRADECDITFSNLAISRKHAEILRFGDGCVLVDLGSRLGTYVNGRRVQRAPLHMGDQILISGVLIEYRVRYEARTERDSLSAPDDDPLARRGTRLHVIHHKGQVVDRIPIVGDTVTFGRDADRDVFIDHPLVSRRHAVLLREGDGFAILDTKSRNGTFVNGRAVIHTKVERGDRIQLGPVRFLFEGDELVHQESYNQVTLEARDLTVRVNDHVTILEDVDIRIQPSELVGIIGPSGSGKTTLLNALSGFRRATSGQVTVNGADLYEEYSTFKTGMGYVPQDDIIHTELTPHQALHYAARLRLPRDTSADEIDRLVDETLEILGITDRRHLKIESLSGGQRKRISLGVELLTRASLLFMDEPTSGLDPGTEARMMRLFRKLANQGRTIVLTTHVMENVDVLDKVAVLYEGRLVYFGPPKEMMRHFGIERATHLYDKLEGRPPAEWVREFRESEIRRENLGTSPAPAAAGPTTAPKMARSRPVDSLRQVRILASRYTRILLGDVRNVGLMAIQPLIIFPAIGAVFTHVGTILFLSALAMFWLGTTNAAREIVKERPIYLREKMVGIGVGPYLTSKVLVLAGVSLLQTAFAVVILGTLTESVRSLGAPGAALPLYAVDLLTANLSGLALGLFISAVASTSEQSTAVLPMVLIPQIVFGGFILDIDRMNGPSRVVADAISTRWTYEALKYTFQERNYELVERGLSVVVGFTAAFVFAAFAWLVWRDRDGRAARRRP